MNSQVPPRSSWRLACRFTVSSIPLCRKNGGPDPDDPHHFPLFLPLHRGLNEEFYGHITTSAITPSELIGKLIAYHKSGSKNRISPLPCDTLCQKIYMTGLFSSINICRPLLLQGQKPSHLTKNPRGPPTPNCENASIFSGERGSDQICYKC